MTKYILFFLLIFSCNAIFADTCPSSTPNNNWVSLYNPIVSASTFQYVVYLNNVAMYCYYTSPSSPTNLGVLYQPGSFVLDSGPWVKQKAVNGLRCQSNINNCVFQPS